MAYGDDEDARGGLADSPTEIHGETAAFAIDRWDPLELSWHHRRRGSPTTS